MGNWTGWILEQKRIYERTDGVFSTQVDMAANYNLPIIIHERSATDEMFQVLEEHVVWGEQVNLRKSGGVSCFQRKCQKHLRGFKVWRISKWE